MKKSDFQPFAPQELLQFSNNMVRFFVGKFCEDTFNYMEIEDIAQDVVLKALTKASSYSPAKGPYSSWVTAIALNTVKSAVYAKKRRRDFLRGYRWEAEVAVSLKSYESDPDTPIRSEQAESRVLSKAYSERDKTILRLRAQGYTSAKIAQRLDVKPSIVALAVHKVKTRLEPAA